MRKQFITPIIILNLASSSAFAAISIQLNYADIGAGGVNNSGVTSAQQVLFESAKSTWEQHLTGYRDTGGPTSVQIQVTGPDIDGPGMILGAAGPDTFVNTTNFTYTSTGEMFFDSADIAGLEADGSLESVVFHEIGHILGLGTLWEEHGLYVAGSFEYTGATALEKYQRDFDPDATFIPVEQDGGEGTAESHWDEDPGNPVANNPDAPYDGSSFNDEVMTGFSSGTLNFLSDVTIGSFFDLGYTVEYLVPPGPFHWDAGSPTGDGTITSADGIWNTTNTNFSNEDGSENAVYVDQAILIFGDVGSEVTLAGIFAPASITIEADNYTFTGGALSTGDDEGLNLTVANASHTLNLNSPITGAATLNLNGAGTVNNLNSISSEILLNSGTLLNNGTGTITANTTIASGARLQTDAGGLGSGIDVTNAGELEITADQTINEYISTGRLFGPGSLTSGSFALNDGSVVNSELLQGNIVTNGNVEITEASEGDLSIQSGVTNLTGSNAGNVNIASGGELRSTANSLSDTGTVTNAGTLSIQGNDSIASYDGTGGTLRGTGILSVQSFKAGVIETQVSGSEALSLSVDGGGGVVTLGAGSTLKFDTTTGSVNVLDVFSLFTNASIVGDATSIGFENFDNSSLTDGVKAIFDVSTGNIFITSSTAEGSTPNSLAVATSILGGQSDATPLVNINGVSADSAAILDRMFALAAISATDDITVQSQLQELSPEVYGGLADYSLRQHLSYTDIVRYAPYMIRSGKFQIFAGANSQSIETDSSIDDADYELEGTGGYFGIANELSQGFRMGIFGAYDSGDITSDRLDLDADGIIFGAFAELDVLFPWENTHKQGTFTAGVSFGDFDFDGTREAQGLTNDVDGINATTLEFGLGFKAALIDNDYFKFSPFVSANYITSDVDSFSETGSINSVSVRDHEKSLFLLNYGLETEWRPTANAFGLTAKVVFQNNFGDDDTDFDSAFASGSDFNIIAPGLSDKTIEGRVGMFYQLSDSARIGASYFVLSGDDIDSANGGNLGISLQW